MLIKHLSKLKLTLVMASLLCCAQSYSTEKPPWDDSNDIYIELIQTSNDEALLNKSTRWDVCGRMAPTTYRMALGVQNNKEQPGFMREMILELYPVDNGNFKDVINQKIMDLAFKMADLADGDKNSDDSPVAHAAWDWCIAQDPQHFADL
jgi:hypothetical protein